MSPWAGVTCGFMETVSFEVKAQTTHHRMSQREAQTHNPLAARAVRACRGVALPLAAAGMRWAYALAGVESVHHHRNSERRKEK